MPMSGDPPMHLVAPSELVDQLRVGLAAAADAGQIGTDVLALQRCG
jgi:hypothetical protein